MILPSVWHVARGAHKSFILLKNKETAAGE